MNVRVLIIGFMLWACVSKIELNSKKVTKVVKFDY